MAPAMTRQSWSPPEREKEYRKHGQRVVATATHTMVSVMQYKTTRILLLHLWRPPQAPWHPSCSPAPWKIATERTQSSLITPCFTPMISTHLRLQFNTCYIIYSQFLEELRIQVLIYKFYAIYSFIVLGINHHCKSCRFLTSGNYYTISVEAYNRCNTWINLLPFEVFNYVLYSSFYLQVHLLSRIYFPPFIFILYFSIIVIISSFYLFLQTLL